VHGSQVGGRRAGQVSGTHEVVPEGKVDDAVDGAGGLTQAVEVIQVTATHLRSPGGQRGR